MDEYTFAGKVIGLFFHFNFSVTSWFRTEDHNKAVGGVPNSQHLKGLAVDIVLRLPGDQVNFTNAAEAAGLEVLDEHTHLHVQAPRTV